MISIALIIVFGVLLSLGFVFLFIPILPSVTYMFVVAVIFDLLANNALSSHEITVLGVITLISIAVDYLSGFLGARWGGASWRALMLGSLGMFLGIFILPPIGIFIGLFLGVVIGEFAFSGDPTQAIRAGSASLLGSLAGIVINFFLCLTFLVLFLVYVLN